MASSSKKWAKNISSVASRVYFLVIILQLPLFRFPCRIGTCTTPIEVTSYQLIAHEVFPESVVKALLFPGAIVRALLHDTAFPSFDKLLNVYKTKLHQNQTPGLSDFKYLEVVLGCYLSVAGAFLGLIRLGRLSLSGVFLIIWGLGKEILFQQQSGKAFCIYSTMWIAGLSAFFSIRGDVRKLLSSCNILHPFKKAKST